MITQIGLDVELKEVHCCECFMVFAITENMYDRLHDSGDTFYCPSGHAQHYTAAKKAKQKITELENKLNQARNREAHLKELEQHRRYQARAYKAHHTRLKNAIIKGKCPCCGDHFEDIQQHMSAKHPTYRLEKKE